MQLPHAGWFAGDGYRPDESDTTFLTHPFRASLLTSSLIFCRSSRDFDCLSIEYEDKSRPSSNASLSTIAIVLRRRFHISVWDNALAPFGSVCLRPCKTPLMRVSRCPGIHTAETLHPLLPVAFAARRECSKSRSVVLTWKGRKAYPAGQFLSASGFIRPVKPKALLHASCLYWEWGRIRVLI